MRACFCSLAGTPACDNCGVNKFNGFPVSVPVPFYPRIQEWIMPVNPTGWICPKCGKVNAPTEKTCDCKEEKK